jgi:hypothetical protein
MTEPQDRPATADLPEPLIAPDAEVERDAYEATMQSKRFTLSDALGEHARRLKRNLMVWSGLSFVVVYYNVRLDRIPWVDVAIPPERSELTPLLVFVPTVYALVSFIVQAQADIGAWRVNFEQQMLRGEFNVLHRMNHFLNEMWQLMERKHSMLRDHQMATQRIRQLAGVAELAGKTFGDSVARGRRVTRWRVFAAYFWESALPVLVGVAAVAFATPSAWRSFTALLSTWEVP